MWMTLWGSLKSISRIDCREDIPLTKESLTLEEWRDLVSIRLIDIDALRMGLGMDPNETWSHSNREHGWHVVVSQFQGQFYVNIRNWWAQRAGEPPRPMKIGIAMTLMAFNKLLEYSIFIEEDIAIIVLRAELRRQEHKAFNRCILKSIDLWTKTFFFEWGSQLWR